MLKHYFLKVVLVLAFLLISGWWSVVYGQSCNGFGGPIGGSLSNESNGALCAHLLSPAVMGIDVTNVDDGGDPNNVAFAINWGDGTFQTITYSAGQIIQTAPNRYEALVNHVFPANGDLARCEYRPTVNLSFGGIQCPTPLGEPPRFVRWNFDDENSGELVLSETVSGETEFLVCEGVETTITFSDRSTLNCVPPGPLSGGNGLDNDINQSQRWRQFVYGVNNTISGNVLIGGFAQIFPFDGPVDASPLTGNVIPFPPVTTETITIPATAQAGEFFEIRMNYWNTCNPYPSDGPRDFVATIRVVSQPTPPTPINNVICSDETVPNFQITIPSPRSRVNWYADNAGTPGAPIVNPNGNNSAQLPPSAYPGGIDNTISGTYQVWASYVAVANVENVSCESELVPVTLEIIDVDAAAGTDQSFCGVFISTPLGGNTPTPPATGEWSTVFMQNPSASVTFSDPNDPNATASVTLPGLYTFRWTVTNGSCSAVADVNVDFGTNGVTAEAGNNEPANCGLTYTLGATPPTVGVGEWLPVAGATFSDTGSPTADVTVTTPGLYTFTWRVTSGVCTPPAEDQVQVTFVNPPAANAINPEVCDATTGLPVEAIVDLVDYESDVTGNAPDRMVTWYRQSDPPPTGVIIPSTQTVNDGDGFIALVQDINTTCTSEATVIFTVVELPEANDATINVCEDVQGSGQALGVNLNDAVFVNAVVSAVLNDVTVRWYYTEADALLDANNIMGPVDITGSETFFARITRNTAPFCFDIAELTVNVISQPAPQPILGKESVCVGALELYQVNPVPGAQYLWDVPVGPGEFEILSGGGTGDFFVLVSFPNLFNGSIRLQVEVNGCTGTLVEKAITTSPSPQPFDIVRPDIDPNQGIVTDFVCSNDMGVSYAVRPNNYSSSTYNWEVFKASDGTPGGGVVANGQTTGNVLVTFLNENVIIRVRESNASNCVGPDQEVFVTVNRRPVMADPSTTICSDQGTAITFETTTASPALANHYNITGVTLPVGLVPLSGPTSGTGAANMIANDAYENQGDAPLIVRYNVVPVRIGGGGQECAGSPLTVSVTVNPKPQLAPDLDKIACSEEEIGLTLYSAPNTFPADRFIIESVNTNGLTPLTPLPPLFSQLTSDALTTARWENNSVSEVSVVYRVRPFSTLVGCAGNPPVDVPVTIFPKANTTPVNPITICSGDELDIPLASTMTGATFVWSIAMIDGSITGATSGQGTAITDKLINEGLTSGRVVYDVRTKNPPEKGGCLGPPIQVEVTVNPFNVDFTIVGPGAQCAGNEFPFEWDVEQNVRYTWSWSDNTPDVVFEPGDLALGNNEIRHRFENGSPFVSTVYSVTLTADNTFCNAKSIAKPVTLFPSINLNINAGDTILCSGESIEFKNQTTGADASQWFYRPLGTSEVIDLRSTVSATYVMENNTTQNPIIYEVVYQASNDEGCEADYTKQVVVYRRAAALFDEGTVDPFVAGVSTVTFTNLSTILDDTQFEYHWDFGDNQASPATSTAIGPVEVNYLAPGQKNIILEVVNIDARDDYNKTCESTFSKEIMIPLPEVRAEFRAIPLAACFPVDIVVENLSPGADTFEWELFGPDGIRSRSTLVNPVFSISKPGVYSITLKATFSGTGQSDFAEQIGLEVLAKPVADFNARPTTVFTPDTELRTFNLSTNANLYQWDFGDGALSEDFEPVHVYQLPGTYEITLVAGQDYGQRDTDGDNIPDTNIICYDTATQEVRAVQGGSTKVPNAFTPSLNGPTGGVPGASGTFNDVFLPITKGVEEFEMQIYDRWGNMVFESKDKNIGWDGYDKSGRLLPAGVYVYKLTLRLADDQRTTHIGDVTLIR